jgi:hypothetical protein
MDIRTYSNTLSGARSGDRAYTYFQTNRILQADTHLRSGGVLKQVPPCIPIAHHEAGRANSSRQSRLSKISSLNEMRQDLDYFPVMGWV